MDGYTAPYRLDRNSTGGGMLLYVRDDIPSKILDNTDFGSEIVEKQSLLKLLQEKLSGL